MQTGLFLGGVTLSLGIERNKLTVVMEIEINKIGNRKLILKELKVNLLYTISSTKFLFFCKILKIHLGCTAVQKNSADVLCTVQKLVHIINKIMLPSGNKFRIL